MQGQSHSSAADEATSPTVSHQLHEEEKLRLVPLSYTTHEEATRTTAASRFQLFPTAPHVMHILAAEFAERFSFYGYVVPATLSFCPNYHEQCVCFAIVRTSQYLR